MVTRFSRLVLGSGLFLFAPGTHAETSAVVGTVADANGGEERRMTAADESTEQRGGEAKSAFDEGLQLLRDGKWADAEQKFRASLALVRRQSTEYNLAFALYMQHRRRECLAVLDGLSHTGEPGGDLRYEKYADLLRTRVQEELSTVRLLVTPATAHVQIDGEPAREKGSERWLQVEPGEHRAKVFAPGFMTKQIVLSTHSGTELEREVLLEPVAAGAPPAPVADASNHPADSASFAQVAPWVVMGVGGALLAAAAVMGILAKEADNDFQRGCPTNHDCPPSLLNVRHRVEALGQTTDVLLVSGGVLVAAGFTWHLLVPAPKSAGPHAVFVGVSGRF